MGLFGSKSDDNSKDVFSRLGKEVKEDMMVNTLEDNDLAKLAAGMKSELTGSESRESITDKLEAELNNESEAIETFSDSVAQDEPRSELEQMAEETAVITAGLVVSGDLDSVGSIDVFGTVEGNVACCGKLTVSGTIEGAIMANEVFANNAKISGDIQSKGSAKIGQGTVVIQGTARPDRLCARRLLAGRHEKSLSDRVRRERTERSDRHGLRRKNRLSGRVRPGRPHRPCPRPDRSHHDGISPAASGYSANTVCTPQPVSCASFAASVSASSNSTKCAAPSRSV